MKSLSFSRVSKRLCWITRDLERNCDDKSRYVIARTHIYHLASQTCYGNAWYRVAFRCKVDSGMRTTRPRQAAIEAEM